MYRTLISLFLKEISIPTSIILMVSYFFYRSFFIFLVFYGQKNYPLLSFFSVVDQARRQISVFREICHRKFWIITRGKLNFVEWCFSFAARTTNIVINSSKWVNKIHPLWNRTNIPSTWTAIGDKLIRLIVEIWWVGTCTVVDFIIPIGQQLIVAVAQFFMAEIVKFYLKQFTKIRRRLPSRYKFA